MIFKLAEAIRERMAEPKTLRVRLLIGCYAGKIRELERSAALDMLRLERAELVDNSLTPEELETLPPAIREVTNAPLARRGRR